MIGYKNFIQPFFNPMWWLTLSLSLMEKAQRDMGFPLETKPRKRQGAPVVPPATRTPRKERESPHGPLRGSEAILGSIAGKAGWVKL